MPQRKRKASTLGDAEAFLIAKTYRGLVADAIVVLLRVDVRGGAILTAV